MQLIRSYRDAIGFLYGLQTLGMKFGLAGIRKLLRSAGNPHHGIRFIHIAGTNGKGSTAALVASALTAAGYRTGLYTSPHLIDFSERIRINGRPIPKHEIVRIVRELVPSIAQNRNTFFESATAIAMMYFRKQKVDVAVLETGLGGRLDATNVVRPVVSVITTIGLEHRALLGNSIEAIAREKGGIIKRSVPCVIGRMKPRAQQELQRLARLKRSPVVLGRSSNVRMVENGLAKSILDVPFAGGTIRRLRVSLGGAFQKDNIATAVSTLDLLASGEFSSIDERSIRKGWNRVEQYSGLRARQSVVRSSPLIIADVAHNPDAVRALVRSLQRSGIQQVRLLIGVMADKEYRKMVHALAPITDHAAVVRASTPRSLDEKILMNEFEARRIPVSSHPSVRSGLRGLMRKGGDAILITGSHFVVGEALACLEGKNYLTISQ